MQGKRVSCMMDWKLGMLRTAYFYIGIDPRGLLWPPGTPIFHPVANISGDAHGNIFEHSLLKTDPKSQDELFLGLW
jgi:hypothetical protein